MKTASNQQQLTIAKILNISIYDVQMANLSSDASWKFINKFLTAQRSKNFTQIYKLKNQMTSYIRGGGEH